MAGFIAGFVYILAALASLGCTILLYLGYVRDRSSLLLWSSFGFFGFTLNNIILFFDLIVYPDMDLAIWRLIPSVAGSTIMIFGLIWDTI